MSEQKLKLGLLLDSLEVPAWLFYSLTQIVHSDYAELSVILINQRNHTENHAAGLDKLGRGRKELAYKILNKVEEKLFLKEPDAFKRINLDGILSGLPLVLVQPVSDGDADVFLPEDVERVREFDLDLIIHAGSQRLQGDILQAAKCGVWFYEHSDNRKLRGGPPGFWEFAKGGIEAGATLSIANDLSQSDWAVYRSRFMTYPFSPSRSRSMIFWWSSSILPRQIELLHHLGKEAFFDNSAKFNDTFNLYDQPVYHIPSNLEAIRIYTRVFAKQLYELYQRLFHLDHWTLLFDFTKSTSLSLTNFKRILPPKDRFWADPHVVQKDGSIFIFVEEYLYKKQKGHISVIEMDLNGYHKNSIPVLEKDYHLSYPFVFESEGKHYMVPESAANHSIDLYECVEFPYRWEFRMSLMRNVNAVDSTLFFHEGKWWLFTMLTENEGIYPIVDLFIFYADNLFTAEWSPHPQNPVVSDATSARPAGKLFFRDGKVYRPSQNCSKTYGYGITISEVECLSETKYIEKKVAAINPDWDRKLFATHTFTYGEGLIVIDGLYRTRKLG